MPKRSHETAVWKRSRYALLVGLGTVLLLEAPMGRAGESSSEPSAGSLITVAKWTGGTGSNRNCEPVNDMMPLEAAEQELTAHGIPVHWARRAWQYYGAVLAACGVPSTMLNAFEIPTEKLDAARTLGFKPWNEWPDPVFIPVQEMRPWPSDLPWITPPFVAIPTGPLLCDEQGKAKPVNRFFYSGIGGSSEDISLELVRAGIPVDHAFCAIRPDHPPAVLCGEDSGNLNVFKIPASSIPRALALGYQLAGVGVEGGIGAVQARPCFEMPVATPEPAPCPGGTTTAEATANAQAASTVATAHALDIRLSGSPKSQAKLRNALGKAVAQGIIVAYSVETGDDQIAACVGVADDVSPGRLDAFFRNVKQVQSRRGTAVSVTERTTSCGATASTLNTAPVSK